MGALLCHSHCLRNAGLFVCRFEIPLSDEAADLEATKDPLMMKAVKSFKANYVSPIQLRCIVQQALIKNSLWVVHRAHGPS